MVPRENRRQFLIASEGRETLGCGSCKGENMKFSRRKFFGLFGGTMAAAIVPKPILALAASEVVPVAEAFPAVEMTLPSGRYAYVRYAGTAPGMVGSIAYWANQKRTVVSMNPRGGGNSMRLPAGALICPIPHHNYGWIKFS